MRVIDSHVHLYPPDANRDPAGWAAARGERHWAQLCTRRRANGRPVQGFPDVDGLLQAMDAAGVDRAVLLGWYWQRHDTCVAHNRFLAACARAHPDRFTAFATMHPGAGDAALAELRRARDDGCAGLGELSPHTLGVSIDHASLGALLQAAGEWRLPVNLHVTDPASRRYPGRVETPLEDFVGLARRHPGTTFVLAHWGGGLDVRGLANVRVDTSAAPLIYREASWTGLGSTATPAQVLFGTDYPLNLYPRIEAGPELGRFLAEARVALADPGDRVAVLGGNAARLLSLPSA